MGNKRVEGAPKPRATHLLSMDDLVKRTRSNYSSSEKTITHSYSCITNQIESGFITRTKNHRFLNQK